MTTTNDLLIKIFNAPDDYAKACIAIKGVKKLTKIVNSEIVAITALLNSDKAICDFMKAYGKLNTDDIKHIIDVPINTEIYFKLKSDCMRKKYIKNICSRDLIYNDNIFEILKKCETIECRMSILKTAKNIIVTEKMIDELLPLFDESDNTKLSFFKYMLSIDIDDRLYVNTKFICKYIDQLVFDFNKLKLMKLFLDNDYIEKLDIVLILDHVADKVYVCNELINKCDNKNKKQMAIDCRNSLIKDCDKNRLFTDNINLFN